MLVSSHNLRELEDICDYVGIIHQGEMVIEKPLDDLKGNVQKIQLVFKDEFPEELKNQLEILHTSKTGSVITLIVKGDSHKIGESIKAFEPVVYDKVNLTLEEVFIYELGGLGYDINSIIV